MTRDDESSEKPSKRSSKPSSRIDESLRRVYRQTVEEDVPDRFQKLIEQLRKQDDRS